MSVLAFVGDCTTTTCLALAAGWPVHAPHDPVIVEADPSGGSIAAWLDAPVSPSLSTLVAALHGQHDSNPLITVDAMIRETDAGVRFIPAPYRAREMRSTLVEAERLVFPLIAAATDVVALLDCGRFDPGRIPAACRTAATTVVCHRLESASAPAATVRLERMAESIESLRLAGHDVAVLLIGDDPFDLDEVLAFAAPGAPGWPIARDDLAAAVFAGRSGVSSKRLGRLPLSRSAGRAAVGLIEHLDLDASLDVASDTDRVHTTDAPCDASTVDRDDHRHEPAESVVAR